MYNTNIPSRAELPSARQLLRSTLIAAVSAAVLLTTVVLPSEYGIDPTGVGRILGLKDMGEIKTRLAQEAADDAAAVQTGAVPVPEKSQPPARQAASSSQATASPSSAKWRDTLTFTLKPGEGTEIKMVMKEGSAAQYAWQVSDGVVNYDTHGDAPGRSISYAKGRAVAADQGELVASFTGNHGWFWRNRGQADVTIRLNTSGAYSDLRQVK